MKYLAQFISPKFFFFFNGNLGQDQSSGQEMHVIASKNYSRLRFPSAWFGEEKSANLSKWRGWTFKQRQVGSAIVGKPVLAATAQCTLGEGEGQVHT